MDQSRSYFSLSKYLENEATKIFTRKEIELYKNLTNRDKQRFFLNAPTGKWHKLGLEKIDFVVDCKIGNNDCYDNFTLYMNSKFFNCYTLKHIHTNTRVMGPESGLSVILAGQDLPVFNLYNIWSKTDNSKSIRVVIHEKNTLPQPVNDAIEILPGMSTSIGIQQKKVERIDTPSCKCRKKVWWDAGNTKVAMTLGLCLNLCSVKYVLDACHCLVPGTVGGYGIQNETAGAKFCLYADRNNLTETVMSGLCYIRAMNAAPSYITNCHHECVWNCEEVTYDKTVSYSKWPEEMMIPDFIDNYIKPKPDVAFYKMYYEKLLNVYNSSSKTEGKYEISVADGMYKFVNALQWDNIEPVLKQLNETIFTPTIRQEYLHLNSVDEAQEKWVQDSFYRVNIYFKQPIVEVHKQILNSNMADLWSAVGGILGLWLGLSVVGAVEILQLIAKLFQILFTKVLFKTEVRPLKTDIKIIDLV